MQELGLNLQGNSLVIDLKPKGSKLSLFKIRNIWGISSDGWTPILLELEAIVVDEDKKNYSAQCFELANNDYDGDTLYTFLYLNGTIKNGVPEGTWNFPGSSPTNSVLLWPDAIKHFLKYIKH